MRYISTRGGEEISAAAAIVKGLCPRGGLYVPKSFPPLSYEALLDYADNYPKMACIVMQPYLDIEEDELLRICKSAYGSAFDTQDVAALVPYGEHESILELFHGPTLAFKDMALQILPYLMRDSMKRTGENKKAYILVATSGDTGKAALAGFQDVADTAVQVFYPDGGVSRAQYLQMATQEGGNVFVCGIEGNFDDAQTAVKRIFADEKVRAQADEKGYRLSSANSINFGRLLPQIVYYFASYARLVKRKVIKAGEEINFLVPTGNFGNILAGYYAKRMGLPVNKFLCASNRNNVLTDFFEQGIYDKKRPFYQSMSCSIDILVSSNLERLLFEICGRNEETVRQWMAALSASGRYEISDEAKTALRALYYADWCDEDATLQTIKKHFEERGYLMDPHTAVAQTLYDRYAEKNEGHTVLLSTAHPYKFASAVLKAFEVPTEDDFQNAQTLLQRTGVPIPAGISALADKEILHRAVCTVEDMDKRVLEVLP